MGIDEQSDQTEIDGQVLWFSAPSLAHGDDELNIIPPDKLFGRAEIVPFCKSCHATHVTGGVYEAFVKKWHSKRRPNGRMILDNSVCTDCHGNHAILRADQQQM